MGAETGGGTVQNLRHRAGAGTLAAMGRCVLLIDGDVGLGNLDLMLGIEGEAVHDLLEVLGGHCPLRRP